MKIWVWLVLFWMPAAASAEVYKCVNQYDIVQYSDKPCGANAQVLQLPAAPKVGTELNPGYDEAWFYRFSDRAKAEQQQRAATEQQEAAAKGNCPSDTALSEQARFGHVALCMTIAMVRFAESNLEDCDVLQWQDEDGQWERWRCRARRETWPYIIVFKNGRVARLVQQFDPYDPAYVPAGAAPPSIWPFKY